jgi:hypothetical protein
MIFNPKICRNVHLNWVGLARYPKCPHSLFFRHTSVNGAYASLTQRKCRVRMPFHCLNLGILSWDFGKLCTGCWRSGVNFPNLCFPRKVKSHSKLLKVIGVISWTNIRSEQKSRMNGDGMIPTSMRWIIPTRKASRTSPTKKSLLIFLDHVKLIEDHWLLDLSESFLGVPYFRCTDCLPWSALNPTWKIHKGSTD